MRRLIEALVVGTTAALALGAPMQVAQAADHRDGAAVKLDPSTDINDVYAWMSRDGSRVYLAMTVFPLADTTARFSNTAKYTFHLTSRARYGATTTATATQQAADVICTFDTAQKASCWVTRGTDAIDYVTGDASAQTGITSTSGKMKVFAGLRDDPFYFNLAGFNTVTASVAAVASGLMLDGTGCPDLDQTTASGLVKQLRTAPGGGQALNFFKSANTLAIVLSLDKTMIATGGPIVGIWGATHK